MRRTCSFSTFFLLLLPFVLFAKLSAHQVDPPVSAAKILAKYPFLKEGTKPEFYPELIFKDEPVKDIVRSVNSLKAVIIADEFNARLLDGFPNVILGTNTIEDVKRVLADPRFIKARVVIGVGGSGSNDLAKAVGVFKDEIISIVTILSTNCISTNRSVIGAGLEAISYRAATPTSTIVALGEILGTDEATKIFWTQSGLGDYFAAISAAIDIGHMKNTMETQAIRNIHPKIFESLDWVNDSFQEYDSESLKKISELLHESSIDDIDNDSNLNRIGGEHALYRVLIEQNPSLRYYGASHGQIVALGTLINAKIFASITGDDQIYKDLKTAFVKLKMPLTYEELEKIGLTKEMLEASLKELDKGSTRSSLMTTFFKYYSCSILDEIF